MAIRNIVFDLGGVLIDWNPRYLYRKIFMGPYGDAEMEDFLATVCNQTWNEQQDGGRPFAEAIAERKAKFPHHAPEIEAYFARWDEMLGEAHYDIVQILNDVKSHGFKTYALSNWSAETFPHAQRKFPFLELFDGRLISGQENLRKPDPKFFELLCSRFQIRADESVFIDDVDQNIQIANALGFKSIHHKSAMDTQSLLSAFLTS